MPYNILLNLEETLLAMTAIEDRQELYGCDKCPAPVATLDRVHLYGADIDCPSCKKVPWLISQRRALAFLENVDLTTDLSNTPTRGLDRKVYDKVQYTIGQALIECIGRSVKPDWWEQEDWDEMREGIACIVYGAGGWNRWGVKYSGEVLFSEYHTRSGDLARVEDLEFGTF